MAYDARQTIAGVRAAALAARTPREMRHAAFVMYVLGGVQSLVSIPLPRGSEYSKAILVAFTCAFVLTGLATLSPRIVPRRALPLAPIVGVLGVGVFCVFFEPATGPPAFYLWPLLYSAYFCSAGNLASCLLLMMASLAGAMQFHDGAPALELAWVNVTIAIMAASILVRRLSRNLDRTSGQLYENARRDALTGLLNRRGFDEWMAGLDVATRAAFVIVDLDHFKRINDERGHATGDELLRAVGRVLSAQARTADLVARLGGEEFVAVLTGCDSRGASDFAERVRGALASATLARGCPVTLSAGIAVLDPELAVAEADPAGAALARADQALYAAKHAGRNRVSVWTAAAPQPAGRLSPAPA